jgi:hypothetical protein
MVKCSECLGTGKAVYSSVFFRLVSLPAFVGVLLGIGAMIGFYVRWVMS